MEDTIKAINELRTIINQYCDLLLLGCYSDADQYIEVLSNSISRTIPRIVVLYDDIPQLEGRDRRIWVKQLEKIISAIQSDDDFLKIDVLKLETIAMLDEFLSYVEQ